MASPLFSHDCFAGRPVSVFIEILAHVQWNLTAAEVFHSKASLFHDPRSESAVFWLGDAMDVWRNADSAPTSFSLDHVHAFACFSSQLIKRCTMGYYVDKSRTKAVESGDANAAPWFHLLLDMAGMCPVLTPSPPLQTLMPSVINDKVVVSLEPAYNNLPPHTAFGLDKPKLEEHVTKVESVHRKPVVIEDVYAQGVPLWKTPGMFVTMQHPDELDDAWPNTANESDVHVWVAYERRGPVEEPRTFCCVVGSSHDKVEDTIDSIVKQVWALVGKTKRRVVVRFEWRAINLAYQLLLALQWVKEFQSKPVATSATEIEWVALMLRDTRFCLWRLVALQQCHDREIGEHTKGCPYRVLTSDDMLRSPPATTVKSADGVCVGSAVERWTHLKKRDSWRAPSKDEGVVPWTSLGLSRHSTAPRLYTKYVLKTADAKGTPVRIAELKWNIDVCLCTPQMGEETRTQIMRSMCVIPSARSADNDEWFRGAKTHQWLVNAVYPGLWTAVNDFIPDSITPTTPRPADIPVKGGSKRKRRPPPLLERPPVDTTDLAPVPASTLDELEMMAASRCGAAVRLIAIFMEDNPFLRWKDAKPHLPLTVKLVMRYSDYADWSADALDVHMILNGHPIRRRHSSNDHD